MSVIKNKLTLCIINLLIIKNNIETTACEMHCGCLRLIILSGFFYSSFLCTFAGKINY